MSWCKHAVVFGGYLVVLMTMMAAILSHLEGQNFTHARREPSLLYLKHDAFARETGNEFHQESVAHKFGKDFHQNSLAYTFGKGVRQEKLAHFRRLCNDTDFTQSVGDIYNTPLRWNIVYSREHNLACKMSAKIGSTFMLHLFSILRGQGNTIMLNESRKKIHDQFYASKRGFTLGELRDYNVIIMGRNPYSRLYSAFIDKIYLPNDEELLNYVSKKSYGTSIDRYKTTFQNFLDYVITTGYNEKNIHYDALFSAETFKLVCGLPNIIFVQQESFSDDIEYVLKIAQVDENIRAEINDILHRNNAEVNVKTITKTVIARINDKFKSVVRRGNLTRENFVERLWISFQIQGIIPDQVEFPKENFTSEMQWRDADYFIGVVLDTLRKRPLSTGEKTQQRYNHMMNAYKEIRADTLEAIKTAYEKDFQVFQYDNELHFK